MCLSSLNISLYFWSPNVWVSPAPSSSAVNPTIQLNPGPIYLEKVGSHRLRAPSHKIALPHPPTPDASHKFWLLLVLLCDWLSISDSCNPSLGLINLPGRLTELGKIVYLLGYQCIIKLRKT